MRQSIIHVEKDDIDIDDEDEAEEETAAAAGVNGVSAANGNGHAGEDDDEELPGLPTSSGMGPISTPTRAPTGAGAAAAAAPLTPHQPTPGPSGVNGVHRSSPQPGAAGMMTPGGGGAGGANGANNNNNKKIKLKISYDKYQMIKSLIVFKLSEMERETGEGVSRPEIVQWYLEQKENEIQTVDELQQERLLVEKVISKLVKEKQLLELVGQGLQGESQEESQSADPILYVHPDYEN